MTTAAQHQVGSQPTRTATDAAPAVHRPRAIRSPRVWLLGLLVTTLLALAAAPASAVIVHLANGRTLSYQPLHRTVAPFDSLFSNLDYGGGPVMPSNTNYTIYWQPSGATAYPSGYQTGVNRYLGDLADDSGGTQNVDSVAAQYNDAAGHFASYNSHYGGTFTDATAYPASGCSRATICLTDEQIQKELKKFIAKKKLPIDLSHEYFLLTPPGVESCFEGGAATTCSADSEAPYYCAYHGNVPIGEAELIYSNDPYVSGNVGCDDGNHPNGNASDGALQGGLSHEHNESITDPEPNNAWTDWGGTGGEIGDKCGNEEHLGAALGKAENGASYNQVVNGHVYWYQEEWSNQSKQCLQRLAFSGAEPTASFAITPEGGGKVTFDASASTAPGGVDHYTWQFNNGGEPGTTFTTTSPVTPGSLFETEPYVALTVFAADGTSIGTARRFNLTDEAPTAEFNATPAAPKAGEAVSFAAKAKDEDGSISSYTWSFGDGSTGSGESVLHTYASAGHYTAKLTVTDSSALSRSVTHEVAVSGGEESSGGSGGGGGGGGVLPVTPTPVPAMPTVPPGPAAANIALAGLAVPVLARTGQASIRLSCAGRAFACGGHLIVTVRVRTGGRGRHFHVIRIASGSFSIVSGQTTVVELTLTTRGRVLLRDAGGHLTATLAIHKTSPSPSVTEARSIRLKQLKAKRRR